MQKSLVVSTIAALGLFACQPNTSDEAASTSADSAKTTSVSARRNDRYAKASLRHGRKHGFVR